MSLRELKVLVADDNRHTRTIMMQVLRGLGVGSIQQAASGVDALRMIEGASPDVVLTDLEMQPGDGIWLARAIRAMPTQAIALMPIILVTAASTGSAIARARDAGVTEIVTKPFSVKSLAARLEKALLQPRPFLRTNSYFGPDRRRRSDGCADAPRRRLEDGVLDVAG